MTSFAYSENTQVPQLPVIDLITLRSGSREDQVTESDIYYAQWNWRLVKLYRLEEDRRKELCSLLVSLCKKVAPELKGSDSYSMWEKVAKDPTLPDSVFS